MNYYNEIDKDAAEWLRRLIERGLIPAGDVDTRSIEDVLPDELDQYTQCHFFAGIGGWSYALRYAGWPEDRKVWTGSCPCQPFSAAGKGKGTADERHLWPAFHWLISQCRPEYVFGEQVAGKAGESWFDIVSADLEAEDYTSGFSVLAACSVGSPHIRKRLYWVANANSTASGRDTGAVSGAQAQGGGERERNGCGVDRYRGSGADGRLANADSERFRKTGATCSGERAGGGLPSGRVANAGGAGLERHAWDGNALGEQGRIEAQSPGPVAEGSGDSDPLPTNGFWRNVDWLGCRDGKWRAVEPGTFPLVNGVSGRARRLRGYGNAIVPQVAAEFIMAAGI